MISLTDQLRLGVRHIEVDVHFVNKGLLVGHCGSAPNVLVDGFLEVVNEESKKYERKLQLDRGIPGCDPNLGSILSSDFRTFDDALSEISDWLHALENAKEFLMVFLDENTDLQELNKVELLLQQILKYFKLSEIFTPGNYTVSSNYFTTL